MKKIYVIHQCMSKTIVKGKKLGFLKAKRVLDIDEKIDKKLLDLKLVEAYNEKKHGESAEKPSDNSAELKVANKALEESNTALEVANKKIGELEVANKALDGFVQQAIKLPKGESPKDYVKAE